MRVSEQTLHGGRMGTARWVLIIGWVGCWVRRFTTTHHQRFLVKRCASANKPCMAGERHGPNKSGQHHPPPTFIYCWAMRVSAKNMDYSGWTCAQGGGRGCNNVNIAYTWYQLLLWNIHSVNCKQQVMQKIINTSMVLYVPYRTQQPWKISSGGKQIKQQKMIYIFYIILAGGGVIIYTNNLLPLPTSRKMAYSVTKVPG